MGLAMNACARSSSFPSPLFPWLINHPSIIPADVSCLMRDTLATGPAWDCLLSRCLVDTAPTVDRVQCQHICVRCKHAQLHACCAHPLPSQLHVLVACTTAALEHLRRLHHVSWRPQSGRPSNTLTLSSSVDRPRRNN